MTSSHRRYLILEQGVGPGVVNFVLNGAMAWVFFRALAAVPLWGSQSIAGDTLATVFLLPFITALIVTPIVRRHVRAGRVARIRFRRERHPWLGRLPEGTLGRAAAISLGVLVVLAPALILALMAIGVTEMRMWTFVEFKAVYAGLLGAGVTPFIALVALMEFEAGDDGGLGVPADA